MRIAYNVPNLGLVLSNTSSLIINSMNEPDPTCIVECMECGAPLGLDLDCDHCGHDNYPDICPVCPECSEPVLETYVYLDNEADETYHKWCIDVWPLTEEEVDWAKALYAYYPELIQITREEFEDYVLL